jgi:hypothetical protein
MIENIPPSQPVPSSQYVTSLEGKVSQLEARIQQLEARLPNTALISPNFLSRSFTVWGHMVAAQLLIAIPLYCLIFLLGALGN